MGDMQQFKCPSCGGSMVFDSASQAMKCEFCDSEFDMDKLNEISAIMSEEGTQQDAQWAEYQGEEMNGMKSYSCSSCGANVVVDEGAIATECVYCGNKIVLEANTSGVLKPDCVIPFALDKEYAKNALKDFYKGKFLLPSSFTSDNRIDKITGLYVPFWLYDCDVDATIVFDAQNRKTWRSGSYEYTKTEYYSVKRSGALGFNSIPVDASSSMDNDYMDSIEPYDLEKIADFNSAYLAGYQADKYDETAEECVERANERIRNSVIDEFKGTTSYDSITVKSSNIDLKHGDIRYAFFPIWMLNTKYQDKIYTFAINAQTGKVVGSLPTSMGKFMLAWAMSAGIAYIVITLIMLMIGN